MKTIKYLLMMILSCLLLAGCKPAAQCTGDQCLTLDVEVDGIPALAVNSRTAADGKVTPSAITDPAVENVYVKAFTSSGLQIGTITTLARDGLTNTWKGSIFLANPTGTVTFLAYAVSSEAAGNMHLYSGTHTITDIQDDQSGVLSIIVEGDESGVDPAYQVGGLGPGGGLVFYDAGDYTAGWRYMEAAPVSWNGGGTDLSAVWGGKPYLQVFTDPEGPPFDIGTGQSNTTAIVSIYGSTQTAAKICSDLNFNSYQDWFLPSQLELSEMRVILCRRIAAGVYNNLGAFSTTSYYWSSTEGTDSTANVLFFSNGYSTATSKDTNKVASYFIRIRPARQF
jgi:hypothetical protein